MTKPYRFQAVGIRQIERFNGRVLLADDMGLGKSCQALKWMEMKRAARPGIIVCPASLKWNWEHEVQLHTSLRAEVLSSRRPPKRRLARIPSLVIINYDILKQWLPYLRSLDPQVVIFDECHYLASQNSLRTRYSRQLVEGVPFVLGLSGTPLTIRPAQLWTFLNIVRPDKFSSFKQFAHRYCEPKLNPWGWEFKGAVRIPELNRKLTKICMIRRRKVDVLKDLPARTRSVVPLDLTKQRVYDLAERDFVNWLKKHYRSNDPRVKAATRAKRLVQFGYLKRLAGELKLPSVYQWIDNFLDSTDEKLIIFGIHTAVLWPLWQRYQKQAAMITGKIIGHKRQLAVDRFNTKKSCRLMLGNLQAAGVGWNAKGCSTTATIELGWTPGEHSQADDRVYGLGRGQAGVRSSAYYLVAHGTVEHKLCDMLQKRQAVLDGTLDGIQDSKEFDLVDQLTEALLRR